MKAIQTLQIAEAEANRVYAALMTHLGAPTSGGGEPQLEVEGIGKALKEYAKLRAGLKPDFYGQVGKAVTSKVADIPKDAAKEIRNTLMKDSLFLLRNKNLASDTWGRALAGSKRKLTAADITSRKQIGQGLVDFKGGPFSFKSLGKDFAIGILTNYLQAHPNNTISVLGYLTEGAVGVAGSMSAGPVGVAFGLAMLVNKMVNELGERYVKQIEKEMEEKTLDTVLQDFFKIHSDAKRRLEGSLKLDQRATITGIFAHDPYYFNRGLIGFGKLQTVYAKRTQDSEGPNLNDYLKQEAARLTYNFQVFVSLTLKRFAYAASAAWTSEQTALVLHEFYKNASEQAYRIANTSEIRREYPELVKHHNEYLQTPGYKGILKAKERSSIFNTYARQYDQLRQQFHDTRLMIVDDTNVFANAIASLR